MANRRIEVFIEKTNDGTYWGTSQNFEEAFPDNLEIAKETGESYADDYANIEFVYFMNISSFFELVPELKVSAIAKKAKMNESLVRQYNNGIEVASQNQLKKIQDAVHELGRELLSIQF